MENKDLLCAKKEWQELKYGMFLHFGLSTYEGISCGSGKFDPAFFNPTELDVKGWAELAKKSGMKYAVLTAKHVDGFCLWPSKYTEYSVKNSTYGKDLLGEFVKAFREEGLKIGLYYALWDSNCSVYHNDKKYAEYVRNQIEELLTEYGEVIELWFDGGWDKEHPTKEWMYDERWESNPMSGLRHGEAWEWDELYDLIHRLQPNCLVANNASSDRPGAVKYFPVDLRIAERSEYIYMDKVCRPITKTDFVTPNGEKVYLPLEFCNTLTPDWFYKKDQHVLHPSVATICGWYELARENNANLLLNVAPDCRGKIPEYHMEYLLKVAERLKLC